MEARRGGRVLNRTDRSVTLTAAGEALRDAIGPPLRSIAQAVEDLNRYRDTLTGRIRLNVVADLARHFTALVCASGAGKAATARRDAVPDFENWITKADGLHGSALATFASGSDGDGLAVRAALTEPWNIGQAAGQIDRLKLIKRQRHGRADPARSSEWWC